MSDDRRLRLNGKTGQGKCRAVVLALRIAGSVLFVYLASYFLMMTARFPAYDSGVDDFTYESCYRFTPSERLPGDFSIYWLSVCWANRLFWPADCLLHPVLEWQYECLEQRLSPQDENP